MGITDVPATLSRARQSEGGRPYAHARTTAVLALDVYEHFYHNDYAAKAAGYVDAFMQIINWKQVSEHFKMAQK